MAIRNSTAGYSLLAISCAALALFAIAAVIVLALIPIYIPTKSATLGSIYGAQKISVYNTRVCFFSF